MSPADPTEIMNDIEANDDEKPSPSPPSSPSSTSTSDKWHFTCVYTIKALVIIAASIILAIVASWLTVEPASRYSLVFLGNGFPYIILLIGGYKWFPVLLISRLVSLTIAGYPMALAISGVFSVLPPVMVVAVMRWPLHLDPLKITLGNVAGMSGLQVVGAAISSVIAAAFSEQTFSDSIAFVNFGSTFAFAFLGTASAIVLLFPISVSMYVWYQGVYKTRKAMFFLVPDFGRSDTRREVKRAFGVCFVSILIGAASVIPVLFLAPIAPSVIPMISFPVICLAAVLGGHQLGIASTFTVTVGLLIHEIVRFHSGASIFTANEYRAWALLISVSGVILSTSLLERSRALNAKTDLAVHLEDMVESRTSQLKHALKVKSQFLAAASHELRTPLNAILGTISLLNECGDLTSEQTELIDTAQSSSELLLSIIGDLLDLSRIEAGRMELDLSNIDAVRLSERVLSILASKAHNKGIRFAIDPEIVYEHADDGGGASSSQSVNATKKLIPLRHTVYCDASRIQQVLLNLVGNSLKFTESGHITVRVSRCAQRVPPSRIAERARDSPRGSLLSGTEVSVDIASSTHGSIEMPHTDTELGASTPTSPSTSAHHSLHSPSHSHTSSSSRSRWLGLVGDRLQKKIKSKLSLSLSSSGISHGHSHSSGAGASGHGREHGEDGESVHMGDRGSRGGYVLFEVNDTGCGMKAEEIEKLFGVYSQLSHNQAAHGGSGLGLALSKAIVHSSGGAIGATSPGVACGSTFWFTLPAGSMSAEAEAERSGKGLASPTRSPLHAQLQVSLPSSSPNFPLYSTSTPNPVTVLVVDGDARSELDTDSTCRVLQYYGLKTTKSVEQLKDKSNEGVGEKRWSMVVSESADNDTISSIIDEVGTDPLRIARLGCQMQDISSSSSWSYAKSTINSLRPLTLSVISRLQYKFDPVRAPSPHIQPLILVPGEGGGEGEAVDVCRDVLVVEDNVVNQTVIRKMLKRVEMNAVITNNGLEAMDLIEANGFDSFRFALLDLQMPVMDGHETIRRIRLHEGDVADEDRFCVVALTANASAEDRERCMMEGFTMYQTKPIVLDKLREVIAKIVK